MGSTVVWQGFDYSWIAASHPLDRLAAMVDEVAPVDGGAVGARFAARLGWGDVGDAADADVCLSSLSSPALQAIHGVASTRLCGRGGGPSLTRGPLERVPLPFAPGAQLVAVPLLSGFSLETRGAPRPVRGFGFRLVEATVDGNLLTFRPEYSFHAQAEYDFVAALGYTVLAAPRYEAHLTLYCHESTAHTPHEQLLLRCAIDGRRNAFRFATLGLTGFDWELSESCRLRRLSLAVDDLRYMPESGRLSFAANLGFSNQAPGAPGFSARYRLDEALWQFSSGRAPIETRVRNELGLASGAANMYFRMGRATARVGNGR